MLIFGTILNPPVKARLAAGLGISNRTGLCAEAVGYVRVSCAGIHSAVTRVPNNCHFRNSTPQADSWV